MATLRAGTNTLRHQPRRSLSGGFKVLSSSSFGVFLFLCPFPLFLGLIFLIFRFFVGGFFSSWVLPAGENFWFEFFWGVVFPLFFFLLLFFSLLSPPLLFPKGDGEGGKKRGMGIGKKGQDEGVGQRKKQMRNKISDSDATAREASP